MRKHRRCLVLNADYSAIGIISWQDAMILHYKNSISVVEYYKEDYILLADGSHHPVPAVVTLKKYVPSAKKNVAFSKKNIFIRDRLTCQYCGVKFPVEELTFDHVIPKCKWRYKGSPTKWENIVTSCYPCNHKKADKPLSETDLVLLKQPIKPNPRSYVLGLAPWQMLQAEWLPYIPKHYKLMMGVRND